jgi:hypothetical protein
MGKPPKRDWISGPVWYCYGMVALTQSNKFLHDRADVHRRILLNARESSAFEGVRVSAKQIHERPRAMASAKKSASGQ